MGIPVTWAFSDDERDSFADRCMAFELGELSTSGVRELHDDGVRTGRHPWTELPSVAHATFVLSQAAHVSASEPEMTLFTSGWSMTWRELAAVARRFLGSETWLDDDGRGLFVRFASRIRSTTIQTLRESRMCVS